MSDDTAWELFRQEALLEVVGKTEYRKGRLETQAQLEVTPSNLTGQPRQEQRGIQWSFSKYFDLGANKVASSKLFCVNTQIFNLILRDSSYGGRYYGTTGLIAKEMGMDEENVRKRIAAMERDDLLLRMRQDDTGGRYIQLNPHYFCAGGSDDEDVAKRVWAKEKAKRVKLQRSSSQAR